MSEDKISRVRSEMDARYAAGDAYVASLTFDQLRTTLLQQAVLRLASRVASFNDRKPLTLDVGCGDAGIAAYWRHTNTVGLELSEVAVQRARTKYHDRRFVVGAIETWDPTTDPGYPFTLVVAVESIEHWTDSAAGLRTIHRALAEGGELVLTTPNRDSLHVRMGKKLGVAVPYCSPDHIHEFGFRELIEHVEAQGFQHEEARGVHLAPYWALERALGDKVRSLTDNDPEVNRWLNEIAETMPTEYAFIQAHRFRKK